MGDYDGNLNRASILNKLDPNVWTNQNIFKTIWIGIAWQIPR